MYRDPVAVLTEALLSYQYSTCDPARNAKATLPNLVNHQNITVRYVLRRTTRDPVLTGCKAYLDLWRPQIAAANSRGKEFVVGTNAASSISQVFNEARTLQGNTALSLVLVNRMSRTRSDRRCG